MLIIHFRRVAEHTKFVANTIGVSTLEEASPSDKAAAPRKVRNMRYFWGTQPDGSAAPIFDFAAEKACEGGAVPSTSSFWPITGIAVAKRGGSKSDVRLVIIGSQMCIPSGVQSLSAQGPVVTGADSLLWHDHSTLQIVVSNPYDPPDQWVYTHQTVPHSVDRKEFKWCVP